MTSDEVIAYDSWLEYIPIVGHPGPIVTGQVCMLPGGSSRDCPPEGLRFFFTGGPDSSVYVRSLVKGYLSIPLIPGKYKVECNHDPFIFFDIEVIPQLFGYSPPLVVPINALLVSDRSEACCFALPNVKSAILSALPNRLAPLLTPVLPPQPVVKILTYKEIMESDFLSDL